MDEMRLNNLDESGMVKLAQGLAAASQAPACVYLYGELGAGKTYLVRAWIKALGHPGPVKSPTYAIAEPYELVSFPVLHLDLYRISQAGELEYLGIEDWLERGLVFVEWPQRGEGWLPPADLEILIEDQAGHQGELRSLRLRGVSECGSTMIRGIRTS